MEAGEQEVQVDYFGAETPTSQLLHVLPRLPRTSSQESACCGNINGSREMLRIVQSHVKYIGLQLSQNVV